MVLASTRANEFPSIFDALIDHGSSTALISEEYVSKLGLSRKCLVELYSAELVGVGHCFAWQGYSSLLAIR